jgi:hypothetical protein
VGQSLANSLMHRALLVLVVVGAVQLATSQAALASDPWTGSVRVDGAGVYDAPGGALMRTLQAGTGVTVSSWVYGPAATSDNYTWADIGGGQFVHSSQLVHTPLPGKPPSPPQVVASGPWADANLTQQILTLYDGDHPVRLSLMNSGRPGADYESHQGIFAITSRVANEEMVGPGYDIPNVLFTQYFTSDAEALHLNYWLTDQERGFPRSHGCLGLAYDDAAFAWRFLSIGSPVYVHA